MKIKRLICPNCGNTEEFIVDSLKKCIEAKLIINENYAELDDSSGDDIDIFPIRCAKCNAELPMFNVYLDKKKEVVCHHCKFKYECFTEKKPCGGFEFQDREVELL